MPLIRLGDYNSPISMNVSKPSAGADPFAIMAPSVKSMTDTITEIGIKNRQLDIVNTTKQENDNAEQVYQLEAERIRPYINASGKLQSDPASNVFFDKDETYAGYLKKFRDNHNKSVLDKYSDDESKKSFYMDSISSWNSKALVQDTIYQNKVAHEGTLKNTITELDKSMEKMTVSPIENLESLARDAYDTYSKYVSSLTGVLSVQEVDNLLKVSKNKMGNHYAEKLLTESKYDLGQTLPQVAKFTGVLFTIDTSNPTKRKVRAIWPKDNYNMPSEVKQAFEQLLETFNETGLSEAQAKEMQAKGGLYELPPLGVDGDMTPEQRVDYEKRSQFWRAMTEEEKLNFINKFSVEWKIKQAKEGGGKKELQELSAFALRDEWRAMSQKEGATRIIVDNFRDIAQRTNASAIDVMNAVGEFVKNDNEANMLKNPVYYTPERIRESVPNMKNHQLGLFKQIFRDDPEKLAYAEKFYSGSIKSGSFDIDMNRRSRALQQRTRENPSSVAQESLLADDSYARRIKNILNKDGTINQANAEFFSSYANALGASVGRQTTSFNFPPQAVSDIANNFSELQKKSAIDSTNYMLNVVKSAPKYAVEMLDTLVDKRIVTDEYRDLMIANTVGRGDFDANLIARASSVLASPESIKQSYKYLQNMDTTALGKQLKAVDVMINKEVTKRLPKIEGFNKISKAMTTTLKWDLLENRLSTGKEITEDVVAKSFDALFPISIANNMYVKGIFKKGTDVSATDEWIYTKGKEELNQIVDKINKGEFTIAKTDSLVAHAKTLLKTPKKTDAEVQAIIQQMFQQEPGLFRQRQILNMFNTVDGGLSRAFMEYKSKRGTLTKDKYNPRFEEMLKGSEIPKYNLEIRMDDVTGNGTSGSVYFIDSNGRAYPLLQEVGKDKYVKRVPITVSFPLERK